MPHVKPDRIPFASPPFDFVFFVRPGITHPVINTPGQLDELLPRLRDAAWLAIDTEADSLHSYPEKLCLVQLSLPGDTVLVDPLAGLALEPFWDILRDRELILHGADYDLRLLYRTAGLVPKSVFDTMLAARVLGIREFGLHHLVASFLGVRLEKGAQKANWSLRPLTPRMTAYALEDSRHLKPLSDALRTRLAEVGRLEWHAQMCAQLIEDSTRPRTTTADDLWRIKGADKLDRRGLGILREGWLWRDREAIASNRPPFFVLAHDTLLGLAIRAAAGMDWEALMPRRYSPRRRAGLEEAIRRGLALPEAALPEPKRHRSHRLTSVQRDRLEDLRRRRDAAAERLALDPSLIASKADLSQLAVDPRAGEGGVLPWQRQLLAD